MISTKTGLAPEMEMNHSCFGSETTPEMETHFQNGSDTVRFWA